MRRYFERLDHVAILVQNTNDAVAYFSDELGLPVVHSEVIEELAVRLTYLNAGNVDIQLLEPLDPSGALAHSLMTQGEGLHHLCFGVGNPLECAEVLSGGSELAPGRGRGRVSVFLPRVQFGVRVELTQSGPPAA